MGEWKVKYWIESVPENEGMGIRERGSELSHHVEEKLKRLFEHVSLEEEGDNLDGYDMTYSFESDFEPTREMLTIDDFEEVTIELYKRQF